MHNCHRAWDSLHRNTAAYNAVVLGFLELSSQTILSWKQFPSGLSGTRASTLESHLSSSRAERAPSLGSGESQGMPHCLLPRQALGSVVRPLPVAPHSSHFNRLQRTP